MSKIKFMAEEFKITTKEECEEYKAKAEVLDLFQHAVKIIINQIYGAFGNSYFYFRNYDIAESITLQGQDLIKFSIKICNHYFKDKWHLDYDLHKHLGLDSSKIDKINDDVVCYVDTDSNYVVFDYILKSIQGQRKFKDEKEEAEFVLEIYNYRFQKYLDHCFEKYAEFYNVKNRMKFKMEKISSRGIWVAKKMYAYRVIYEDFFRDQKTKASGLPSTKSSFPIAAREVLWKVTDICLDKNYDLIVERDLIPVLRDEFEKFKKRPIDELCYNKNCNGITKYAVLKSEHTLSDGVNEAGKPIKIAICNETGQPHMVETKKKGLQIAEITGDIGVYYTVKGCGADVKGCLWYNSILIETGNKKYNTLRDGEKVKMYYAKNDEKPDVATFCFSPGSYDKNVSYDMDYETQFDYAVLRPLNALLNAMNKQSIGKNLKRQIVVRGLKKGQMVTDFESMFALNKETLDYEPIPKNILKYAVSDNARLPEHMYEEFEGFLGKYGDDLVIMPEKEMNKYITQRENAEDKRSNLNLINSLPDSAIRFYNAAIKYLKEKYKFKLGYDKDTKLSVLSHKTSKKTLILYLETLKEMKCTDALVNYILDYFDDLNGGEDGDE